MPSFIRSDMNFCIKIPNDREYHKTLHKIVPSELGVFVLTISDDLIKKNQISSHDMKNVESHLLSMILKYTNQKNEDVDCHHDIEDINKSNINKLYVIDESRSKQYGHNLEKLLDACENLSIHNVCYIINSSL